MIKKVRKATIVDNKIDWALTKSTVDYIDNLINEYNQTQDIKILEALMFLSAYENAEQNGRFDKLDSIRKLSKDQISSIKQLRADKENDVLTHSKNLSQITNASSFVTLGDAVELLAKKKTQLRVDNKNKQLNKISKKDRKNNKSSIEYYHHQFSQKPEPKSLPCKTLTKTEIEALYGKQLSVKKEAA